MQPNYYDIILEKIDNLYNELNPQTVLYIATLENEF